MDPISKFVVGSAAGWLVNRWLDSRTQQAQSQAQAVQPLPELPHFAPEQAKDFTNRGPQGTDPARHFDADVISVMLGILSARSVVPVMSASNPELGQMGRAWRILPLTAGYPRASDIIQQAWAQGMTVLGSLSLVLLPIGSPELMILMVGGPESRVVAAADDPETGNPGGFFAVIDAPAMPAEVGQTPEPAPQPAADPFPQTVEALANELTRPAKPAKAPKPNGVAKKPAEDSPVIDTDGVESRG